MLNNLEELKVFLEENMRENYNDMYIVHLYNSLIEFLVDRGEAADLVVSVKYIDAAERNMFAYAYNSDESGLVVCQTFDIETAVDFDKFAYYIDFETCGNYHTLSFENMGEFLSNLY